MSNETYMVSVQFHVFSMNTTQKHLSGYQLSQMKIFILQKGQAFNRKFSPRCQRNRRCCPDEDERTYSNQKLGLFV